MEYKKITEIEYYVRNKLDTATERLCSVAHKIEQNVSCDGYCHECFYYRNKKQILEVLLREHKEKPKLTDDEKVILTNLPKEYKWIARNENGNLYIFKENPTKSINVYIANNINFDDLSLFNNLFKFIKWEDEEPYSIEKLLEE